MEMIDLEKRIKQRFDAIAQEDMYGVAAFPCCIGCKFVINQPSMDCCKIYSEQKPEEAYDDDYACPHYQK